MKLLWTIPGMVVFPPIVLPATAANPLGAWRTFEKNPPHYGILAAASTPGPILAIGTNTRLNYNRTPSNPMGVYQSFNQLATIGSD